MPIEVSSSAFQHEGTIPPKYTCDGEDVSPPLAWSGLPDEAKSLVLINDDPDAPVGTWVHWVVYDLPPDSSGLPEAVPAEETLESRAKQGRNSWGRIGYGGPCPPSGTHRYFFKLYALDTQLGLPPGKTKEDVEQAMEGHIVAQGELMGRYSRQR